MPGFYISNFPSYPKIHTDGKGIDEIIDYKGFHIERHTSSKFEDDKLFSWANDGISFIVLEGVVLNKNELRGGDEWLDYISKKVTLEPEKYFDEFRGNFAGGHYNKNTDDWLFYTSPIQDKPLYYYNYGSLFVVSTDLSYVVYTLRVNQVPLNINETAVYDMLSYGFMTDNYTYIDGIKKVPYGSYLKRNKNGIFQVCQYYELEYCNSDTVDLSEEEIIDKMDELFRNAVRLEYQKDEEYGYRHITALSGGLDSRMALWVACDLGFNDILNINFCQSDYLDEIIAKKVSQALHTELIVKSLNDGRFLKDFNDIIKMNSGLSLYSGISHANSILKYLNFESFGLMHTGDIGDAIVGTFDHGNPGPFPGAYSSKLAHKAGNVYNNQGNLEKYKMITRGFNGVVVSMLGQDNYIENVTPFVNRDFFDFCISKIPHRLRDEHYIYKKWIIKKYPKAAEIPVERYNNGKITDSELSLKIRRIKKLGFSRIVEWILWKLKIKKSLNRKILKNDMNPFDRWYEENEDIRNCIDAYYSVTLDKVVSNGLFNKNLIDDIEWLYKNGTTIEKTQVITALGAIDLLLFSPAE